MAVIASHAYALFALTWAAMCALASAVVLDAMLRGTAGPDRS